MLKLAFLGLLLLWTAVAGARFLPDPKKERLARLITDGARSILMHYNKFIRGILSSLIFISIAGFMMAVIAAIPLWFVRESFAIAADVPLVLIILILFGLAISLVVLVPACRFALGELPDSVLATGVGELTLGVVLTPLAKYKTGSLDDSSSVIKDAWTLLFFTFSILGQLLLLGSFHAVSAVFSLVLIAGLLSMEVALFPVLLAGRLGRQRPATELFIMIGWATSVVAIIVAVFIETFQLLQRTAFLANHLV